MKFRDAITYCRPSISKDESRPWLRGYAIRDNCLCTTDGHRLHIAKLDEELPDAFVTQDQAEAIAFGMTIPLEDNDAYPPIARVIPANRNRFTLEDARPFAKLVEEIRPRGRKRPGGTRTIVFTIEQGAREVKIENAEGVKVTLPAPFISGNSVRIGIDSRYVADALRGIRGPVEFSWGDATSPIDIQSEERRAIIMPVMLK